MIPDWLYHLLDWVDAFAHSYTGWYFSDSYIPYGPIITLYSLLWYTNKDDVDVRGNDKEGSFKVMASIVTGAGRRDKHED